MISLARAGLIHLGRAELHLSLSADGTRMHASTPRFGRVEAYGSSADTALPPPVQCGPAPGAMPPPPPCAENETMPAAQHFVLHVAARIEGGSPAALDAQARASARPF